MDPHTLKLLEFSRILEELQQMCFSPQGRLRLAEEPILTDARELEERLDLATAFRRCLESGRPLPPLDFPDLSEVIRRSAKSGSLFEAGELAASARSILSARRLKRHVEKTTDHEGLRQLASAIPDLSALAREIFACLDLEGNLKESKIPSLRGIRERIIALRRDLEKASQRYLENGSYRSYWQTDTFTVKDGRTVLPLKANFKGRIKGVVHEVSASGSTLFLEPLDIVDKNNAVLQEESRYAREVARILRELSGRLAESSGSLALLVQAVAELDTLQARAAFASRRRCAPAEVSPAELILREARHPLLGERAVPISLSLEPERRVLIVTGPNTGGKTLTLKTVGLLALMHQFGMEIPAQEGSRLPVFGAILADIGDEQSIEQSLSTFSGHVRTIARIVGSSGPDSLVLLDELGSGTDPEEGVALAMALLDHFIEKGCFTFTTTHHGILKHYGYSRAGVMNASMDFDPSTLSPTYRILIGIPGESHAVEIAEAGGMPAFVIKKTRRYLEEERGDIAELIRNLTQKERELRRREDEYRNRESEQREQQRSLELKELRVRQKERELKEHGAVELRRFLKESRKTLSGLIQKLAGEGVSRKETRETAEFIGQLENRLEQAAEELEHLEDGTPEPAAELREGMNVVIRGSGMRGKILRRHRGGTWVVETETLRANFPTRELRPFEQAPLREAGPSIEQELASGEPLAVLDLRGLRLEEALHRLEKQIDLALIRGLREFQVIHGYGEGILQRGVHQYLKERAEVKDYFFSPPEEGGFGKTIVRL